MSRLDSIKTTLENLAADPAYPMSGGVFYGICNAQSLPEWNYFVFNRRRVISANNHQYTDFYEVHIIHEDYVMEGYELEVIRKLKEALGGLSLAEDVTYDYTTKADTDVVVEVCNLVFKKAKKVVDR